MTQPEALKLLLEAVATGEIGPAAAQEKLKHFTFEPIEDFAKIDHHRRLRTGFPEVIWGPGKTSDQIAQIMETMRQRNPVVMATRIEPTVYEQLQEKVPGLQYYPVARICVVGTTESVTQHSGVISVLTAGTADLPVAEEAALTAELSGFQVQRLWDVGVAGIHRLLSHREVIDQADVLVVVAGMEGALPSVVAGMADCPVIAVPTSVGYGASFAGVAPLLTMLNSCAAGVGVVNIDNGFGAAVLAGQILRTAQKLPHSSTPVAQGSAEWNLAYAHDANGEPTAGEIATLVDAIRQGCQVRLLIDFPEQYEYISEAQNLWIKKSVVYAQTTTPVSFECQGDAQDDAYQSTMFASTQGELKRVGKYEPQGNVTHQAAISWFIK
jgi:NCAIR mutase (PurE)-related protein